MAVGDSFDLLLCKENDKAEGNLSTSYTLAPRHTNESALQGRKGAEDRTCTPNSLCFS